MSVSAAASGGGDGAGGRTADSRSDADAHHDAETDELAVLARLRKKMLGYDDTDARPPVDRGGAREPELVPGGMVRRYRLVQPLGTGGMGEVWLAVDPRLDRKLAIKVLRPHAGRDPVRARARLVREARAIAQVVHPNVIAVFDAGTLEDDPSATRAFIAMEHILGRSLDAWLAARPRTRQDVLGVFVQAGRGLAAAHRAGQIHRDFKPANVMVGDDGAVKVLDFGLALAEPDMRSSAGGETDVVPRLAGDGATDRLTEAGMVLGTPHYMSPEQHTGATVGAASDQFSFCVALLEAMQRAPAFLGRGAAELGRAKLRGAVQRGPVAVPTWLRAALVRGLSPDPADRWPSMDALLDRLTRRTHRMLAAVAAAGVLGMATTVAAADDRCDLRDGQLEARASAVAEGLAAQSSEAIAARAMDRLRAHDDRLVVLEHEACVAHRDRALDDVAFDRRAACLQDRRVELAATLDAIEHTRGERSQSDVLDGLLAPDGCVDDAGLAMASSVPRDPATARTIASARSRLASARALRNAGLPRAAAEEIASARAAVRDVGEASQHIHAEIDALAGGIELDLADPAAVTTLERGLATAQGLGDDALAAEIAAMLVHAAVQQTADDERIASIVPRADAVIVRAGDPPEARADFLVATAVLHTKRGDFARSLEAIDEARALYAEAVGEQHRKFDAASRNRGIALVNLRRHDEGVAAMEEVVASRERRHGSDHPSTLDAAAILGVARTQAGDLDGATIVLRDVVDRTKASLGPSHPSLAFALGALAEIAVRRDALPEAYAALVDALAIAEQSSRGSVAETATLAAAVARIEHRLGDLDRARRHYEQAIAGHERMLGRTHALVAEVHWQLAEVELAAGDVPRARTLAREAVAILEELNATPEQLAVARRPLEDAERALAASRGASG